MHLLCFKFVESFEDATTKLQEIGNLFSNLFEKNWIVKQWQSNELTHIDSKSSLLEKLTNALQNAQRAIITTPAFYRWEQIK